MALYIRFLFFPDAVSILSDQHTTLHLHLHKALPISLLKWKCLILASTNKLSWALW